MKLLRDILWCYAVAWKYKVPLFLTWKNNCRMNYWYRQTVVYGNYVIDHKERHRIFMSLRPFYRENFRQIFLHELRHYHQLVKLGDKYNMKGDQKLDEVIQAEWDANMFSIKACNRLGLHYNRGWTVRAYESYLHYLIRDNRQLEAADESYRAWRKMK